jgi:hypothetical protein
VRTSSRKHSEKASCSRFPARSRNRSIQPARASHHYRYVDSFGILPLPSRGAEIERTHLCCSFHAPTLHQAAALAGELRAIAASAPRIRAVVVDSSPRRDWIVTFVTPLIPLTLAVLRRWEAELLDLEQRFSGCRFLGWRTRPAGPSEADQASHETGAATDAASAQRQLVASASRLLEWGELSLVLRSDAAPRRAEQV